MAHKFQLESGALVPLGGENGLPQYLVNGERSRLLL